MTAFECEACEAAPVVVEETCDEGIPYRVCTACHLRLMARALRPREWYNLAKRHGWWKYLLHDDFYDDDGTAHQPEQDVDEPELHPAPTLLDVADDPNALFDFTITRWHFETDLAATWQAMDQLQVLRTIERRYSTTELQEIRSAALEIAACSLGPSGCDFVTSAWRDFREPRQLGVLAHASAACLDFDEGFSRVVNALADMDDKNRRESMYALSYFRSRRTLDWIEANVSSPITESWGRLAAASRFDWGRAVAWLNAGRWLSLVALDALAAIVRPLTPLLRELAPELEDKPARLTFAATLNEYAQHDPAPRVTRITKALIEHSATVTQP